MDKERGRRGRKGKALKTKTAKRGPQSYASHSKANRAQRQQWADLDAQETTASAGDAAGRAPIAIAPCKASYLPMPTWTHPCQGSAGAEPLSMTDSLEFPQLPDPSSLLSGPFEDVRRTDAGLAEPEPFEVVDLRLEGLPRSERPAACGLAASDWVLV